MRETILDEKPLIHVWGPLYRHFVSPIAWPFLRRVRSLVGSNQKAPKRSSAGGQLGKKEHAILDRLNQIEAQNTRQWEAIERLLLCNLSESSSSLFRQVDLDNQIDKQEHIVHDRLNQIEAQNTRQWEAIERLLLCILTETSTSLSRRAESVSALTGNRVVSKTPDLRVSSRVETGDTAPASRKKTGGTAPASRKKTGGTAPASRKNRR